MIVFSAIQPLNLILQKGDGSLCLADIPVYLERTLRSLNKLKTASQRSHFLKQTHDTHVQSATTEILNLPPSARTRSNQPFVFYDFETKVYLPFIDAFTKEVKGAFTQLEFWLAFVIFDPRKLPEEWMFFFFVFFYIYGWTFTDRHNFTLQHRRESFAYAL